MSVFASLIVPFLVAWLIYFAAIYMIVEYGQGYLYDESTPNAGLKILLASLLLAMLQAWFQTSYDGMFMAGLGGTVVQAICWFVVFTLILRFHPWHALGISLVAMVLLTGAANLAASSMRGRPGGPVTRARPEANRPLRKSLGSSLPPSSPPPATGDAKDAEAEGGGEG